MWAIFRSRRLGGAFAAGGIINGRAVITQIADTIIIVIRLPGVVNGGAVVRGIGNPVPVGIGYGREDPDGVNLRHRGRRVLPVADLPVIAVPPDPDRAVRPTGDRVLASGGYGDHLVKGSLSTLFGARYLHLNGTHLIQIRLIAVPELAEVVSTPCPDGPVALQGDRVPAPGGYGGHTR